MVGEMICNGKIVAKRIQHQHSAGMNHILSLK